MPGGPQAEAVAPQVPDAVAVPAQPAAPAEPEDAGAPAEPEVEAEAEAETAQHAKPKPSEPRARPQKFVPAEHVVLLRKSNRDDSFSIQRGRFAGLSMGMVLQVVAAPVKDGKAKLVGEAKVLDVWPRRSTLSVDTRVRNAGKADLYVVLPRGAGANARSEDSESEPHADAATPPTETPAQPPAPRVLNGRVVPKSIGPIVRLLEVTNSDSFTWNDCILVARGRDVFRLGGMARRTVREIPLSGFERGVREVPLSGPEKGVRQVPYVGRDRVRIICTEGEGEFYAKL